MDVRDLLVVVEREITAVLAKEGRSSSTVDPWVVRDDLGRESVTSIVERIDLQGDRLPYVVLVVAQMVASRIACAEEFEMLGSRGCGVAVVVLEHMSRG